MLAKSENPGNAAENFSRKLFRAQFHFDDHVVQTLQVSFQLIDLFLPAMLCCFTGTQPGLQLPEPAFNLSAGTVKLGQIIRFPGPDAFRKILVKPFESGRFSVLRQFLEALQKEGFGRRGLMRKSVLERNVGAGRDCEDGESRKKKRKEKVHSFRRSTR